LTRKLNKQAVWAAGGRL